jgi:hypothetical protein
MEINIDKKNLKASKTEEDIKQSLLAQISTGKAILFTGAGFSTGTTNINTTENFPNVAKDLAIKIGRLGGFDSDNDLQYAADRFLRDNDAQKLIDLLKEQYTLKKVSDEHISICKVEWMRYYTTNYDESVEMSSRESDKLVECVDLSSKPSDYKNTKVCIHLNGSIRSLTKESLNTGFKLSSSSYLSSESFTSSNWFYHFKRDLERSSAIVFIGYSMYDIDIQRILFEKNEEFKNKTYFITKSDPDEKTRFTLSKFGHILPIEVAGFAKLVNDNMKSLLDSKNQDYILRSLVRYDISDSSMLQNARDSDVEKMLMYGDIKDDFIDNAILDHQQKRPVLVIRSQLENVLKRVHEGINVLITGELGNGKTIFLRELKTYLSIRSVEAYDISDESADYIGDIDELARLNKKVAIMLDSYTHEYSIDLLRHYCSSRPKNITIIASDRTSEHLKSLPMLEKMGFQFEEFYIDSCGDTELKKFIEIIDNLGFWGNKAGLSPSRKESLLAKEHNGQISSILLWLFDAPQIKDRVNALLGKICVENNYKNTVFAIALLQYLDVEANFSLISEVAGNAIYSSQLRHDDSFKQLFTLSNTKIKSKSSLFCLSLIKNYFSASYIAERLLEIAKQFSKSDRDRSKEHIFKSILRFSSVERLLPDENKKNSIKNYYEDLKTNISWLRNDPHYWLQYAMAHMMFKEYTKAQTFLEQAYSLAKSRNNYDTKKIDTQQARLYILVACSENSDSNKVSENFEKSHKLLCGVEDDVYKFRQVQLYRDYFESRYDKLSKKNKTYFEHACKDMIDCIEKANNLHQIVKKAEENLRFVLSMISKKR